jgi:hypothetical protein
MGRGRINTALIFSHLQATDMSYRLNRQKNLGQGTKVCIFKQPQSQVCSVWPLSRSKGPQRSSGENGIAVITWGEKSVFCEMITPAPWWSLVITGDFMWSGGLSCKSLLFHMGGFSPLSQRCYQFCPFWKWLQREWLRAKTHKMETAMPNFSCF